MREHRHIKSEFHIMGFELKNIPPENEKEEKGFLNNSSNVYKPLSYQHDKWTIFTKLRRVQWCYMNVSVLYESGSKDKLQQL